MQSLVVPRSISVSLTAGSFHLLNLMLGKVSLQVLRDRRRTVIDADVNINDP